MYWFYVYKPVQILLWISITLLHTLGGWLITTHVFNLRSKERLLVGFGLGLTLYLWFCNLLGRWFDIKITFILSAIIVLIIGLLCSISKKPFLNIEDLRIWPWILTGLALIWVFLRVSKGTGLFDEYKNLALISIIANGEIPPRPYVGSNQLLGYHYGFHIWGASLMKIGGLMPWSAFDLSKSIIWGYTILLACLIGDRHIQNRWGAVISGIIMTFVGGTRYLLLLLPSKILLRINESIQLMGTSMFLGDFTNAMVSGWLIDGGPPIEYPFAFLSGIHNPYVIAHAGSTTLGRTIFFLFVLLAPQCKNIISILFMSIYLSYWSLTDEASYGLLSCGIVIYFVWQWVQEKQKKTILSREIIVLMVAFCISWGVSTVQGGTISEMVEDVVIGLNPIPQNTVVSDSNEPSTNAMVNITSERPREILGFSIRWPPAVLSAHLGSIQIQTPLGIGVAILEMGLVVVFLPWLSVQIFRRKSESIWIEKILILTAWIGVIFPILFRWSSERDITRFTSFGIIIIVLLLLVELPKVNKSRKLISLYIGTISLSLMVFSGIVLAGTQLTAGPITMFSDGYDELDANIISQVWGKFPEKSKIFGPVGRGNILTGQLTGGIFGFPPGEERQIWEELSSRPSLRLLLANNFDFLYLDEKSDQIFKENLEKEQCVSVFGMAEDDSKTKFSAFYDLRDCYPSQK